MSEVMLVLEMLNHMVEKARNEKIFCREDTATERRVLAAFLYHAGLSYRKIERFIEWSHVAVHDWYYRLSHLFEVERDSRDTVVVDETKLEVDGEGVYVWAGIDVDTFEVIHVDVSRGRSSLDAFLFLRELLKRCRGKPLIKVDRGPWYNWALETLGCSYEKETFGERSLVEAWFGVVKYRTMLFWYRFPHHSTVRSTQRWIKSFATLHNSML